MADIHPPERGSEKRPKVTRIEGESATYRWLIPAALILVAIITLLLIAASVAVIFDVLPRG